jgi:hypothetical protein
MFNNIESIVNNIEIANLKKIQIEFDDVINIISEFIISKNLILYGGLVINLMLPKKLRFYKDYTMNDYDCYSKNPLKDSFELAKIIEGRGYRYIKIKRAIHTGTYKVLVYGKQIFDISIIDNDTYEKYLTFSNAERKSIKHYNSEYNILPLDIIKKNLYYELSRPEQSGHRWEKIYNRLNLITTTYPSIMSKKVYKCLPIEKEYNSPVYHLLKYIKNNKNPIIDSFSLKLYEKSENCCYRLNTNSVYITILTEDYDKSKTDITEILNKCLDLENIKECEIICNHDDKTKYNEYPSYTLQILNIKTKKIFNIVKIVLIKNECFSINKIKGYTVGSIDTCLYFIYNDYVINKIFKNDKKKSFDNLYYINQYDNYIKNNIKEDVKKRLKIKCYGDINNEEILKRLWDKKMTVEKISNI